MKGGAGRGGRVELGSRVCHAGYLSNKKRKQPLELHFFSCVGLSCDLCLTADDGIQQCYPVLG